MLSLRPQQLRVVMCISDGSEGSMVAAVVVIQVSGRYGVTDSDKERE